MSRRWFASQIGAAGSSDTVWDLDITYSGQSASSPGSYPCTALFSPDGTVLYSVDLVADLVYQQSVSTAFDVSTAGAATSFDTTPTEDDTRGLAFSPDLSEMYVGGSGTGLSQWTLGTPGDVTTATLTATYDPFNPTAIYLREDGTQIFAVNQALDVVQVFDLSTPFDLSSASDGPTADISGQTTTANGLTFQPDGSRMFVSGASTIYAYDLSTPWDLTSASYSGTSFDTASQATNIRGLSAPLDGSLLLVSDAGSDTFYAYVPA